MADTADSAAGSALACFTVSSTPKAHKATFQASSHECCFNLFYLSVLWVPKFLKSQVWGCVFLSYLLCDAWSVLIFFQFGLCLLPVVSAVQIMQTGKWDVVYLWSSSRSHWGCIRVASFPVERVWDNLQNTGQHQHWGGRVLCCVVTVSICRLFSSYSSVSLLLP